MSLHKSGSSVDNFSEMSGDFKLFRQVEVLHIAPFPSHTIWLLYPDALYQIKHKRVLIEMVRLYFCRDSTPIRNFVNIKPPARELTV